MDDVIFNVKKTKPQKLVSKKLYVNYVDRQLSYERDKLADGYQSTVDPAIEGLDSNYDNRLEDEYKRVGFSG